MDRQRVPLRKRSGGLGMELPAGTTAVGVAVLEGIPEEGFRGFHTYKGVSFCEAVSMAREKPLIVRSDSIETCKWSPAVLGLKAAEDEFERALMPRLQPHTAALLLAPLGSFPAELRAQVVILQGPADALRAFLRELGKDRWATEWAGEIDKSALGLELGGLPSWKLRAISRVNQALAYLMPHPLWQRFTRIAFRSRTLSRMLEAMIKPFMASMSVCRNSTVIPLLNSAANLSFFCAGGITWGGNPPGNMTCGVPAWFLDAERRSRTSDSADS